MGAQAAGPDRQTDTASGVYCLLQPPARRPTYSKKLTSLTIGAWGSWLSAQRGVRAAAC